MNRCLTMLSFALIFLQIFCCHAAVTGTGVTTNEENSPSESSGQSLLPCSFRGNRIPDGGIYVVDDCTECGCDNSTIVCSIQKCPVISCSDGQEPIEETGECCERCPDPLTEEEVVNENYDCIYRNTTLQIDEVYVVDECTRCVCKEAHMVECKIRSCPSYFCDFPITFDGECCGICPYYLPVWKVQPSEPNAITAGTLNKVIFDLVVHISFSTSVGGNDMIKVSAWAADENGNRVGYTDQVLFGKQDDISLYSVFFGGFQHRIDGIEFALDASDATCSQMKHLCVELAKGDNPIFNEPRIGHTFEIEGLADEYNYTKLQSNLVGCIPFPKCQDAGTNQISFSVAKKTGQIAHALVAILGWSDEFNNVGGAFDSETGIFISSETGSYFFTYQITDTPNAYAPQVTLMKNDDSVLVGSSSSNSIILDLEVDDTVWLQLQGELIGTSERFSTFSGFLI